MGAADSIRPADIVKLRKGNDGGGPHSITGPICVDGAEPGDTLEIHISNSCNCMIPKAVFVKLRQH
jgi:acetamidase/formamidase